MKAAEFLYRKLLLAYPAEFRERFAEEMIQVFRTQLANPSADGGTLNLAVNALLDLLRGAVRQRWTALDKVAPVLLAVGLAGGAFATYVDFHNDEVQPAVLVVLVVACALGVARPMHACRWALLVGGILPLTYIVGPQVGIRAAHPPTPNAYVSLLALIPALTGAYVGAGARLAGETPMG